MNDHTTPIPQTKTCTKCGESKPATDEYFTRQKTGRDGLTANCKVCRAEYNRARRANPPEPKPVVIVPDGYKHCTKCKEDKPLTVEFFYRSKSIKSGWRIYCRACRRVEYIANKERNSEQGRAHRAANKERYAAWMSAWYAANRDRRLEYRRAWNEANPERYAEHNRIGTRNYNARKRKAEGIHTAEDIKRQYAAQKGKCYYCKCKVGDTYDVDHIIPLSRGGSNWPENLVITCPACNRSKHNKLPHEWPQGGRLI